MISEKINTKFYLKKLTKHELSPKQIKKATKRGHINNRNERKYSAERKDTNVLEHVRPRSPKSMT